MWPRGARCGGCSGGGRGDADNDKLHDFTLDVASYEGAHERLVRRQCCTVSRKCHLKLVQKKIRYEEGEAYHISITYFYVQL